MTNQNSPSSAVERNAVVKFLRDEAAAASHAQAHGPETDKLYRMGQKDGLMLAAEAIERGHHAAALDTIQQGHWQPIESAPKDGTRIDLWVVRLSSSGKHHDEHRAPEAYWDCERERWRCKWLTANGYPAFDKHYTTTHWMPLPPPPEGASNG